jgi:hypothetical protein
VSFKVGEEYTYSIIVPFEYQRIFCCKARSYSFFKCQSEIIETYKTVLMMWIFTVAESVLLGTVRVE